MPRHIEAWLDNRALSSAGPFILQQVHEDPPEIEIQTGERPGRAGQLPIGIKRNALRVALEVQVRELFDLSRRTHAVEELARWANGSVLELSNHPGRRLNVICTADPSLGADRDYTSTIRVEFTADLIPYWEDAQETAIETTNAEDEEENSESQESETAVEDTLAVPGTAPAPVIVRVTPATGETLHEFTVTVGGNTVTLENLSVSGGETLSLDRDARDNLNIHRGTSQLLSKRTAASADDLIADPGNVSVSWDADAECVVTFGVRGRWR